MPPLLRYDTIRLIEASIESLHLAISSLGATKRVEFRQQSAAHAIEIGLIGAAAELAMGACLVQAFGPSTILWPSGQYKTAGQILEDFRTLLRGSTINSEFLTQGVGDAVQHRDDLFKQTTSFRRLIPIRAVGLHAGRGLLHEATVVQANSVADFLELLGRSTRIHPYMTKIPRCLWYSEDRTLIIEDISRRLQEAHGPDRAVALASLYLVLPDIPNEEPEWLQALERVAASPKEGDISYLLSALQHAVPATLRRAGGVGAIVPVVVRPNDPNAIPIAPQYLRRQFNEIPELWHADIATANGRLENGSLDLPPADAVREVFALGLERAGVIGVGDTFTAHQSWAPIVTSFSVQGTLGPYWFIVRRTPDLGQLTAQLQRAGEIGSRAVRQNIEECIHGIEAIRNNHPISRADNFFASTISDISAAERHRGRLLQNNERNQGHNRALPVRHIDALREIAEGGQAIGPLLDALLSQEDVLEECLRYWSKILADSAIDTDDLPALIIALSKDGLSTSHTAIRKALRRIDFRLYGPPIEL